MAELLHERIYKELLYKISSHFYDEGDRLPTEAELASQYHVSKAPVRQALDSLQQKGFIIRRPGKGTFIAGRMDWPHANLGGFEQNFDKNSKYLYCKTLSVQEQIIPKNIALSLNVPLDTVITDVRRIRYFNDCPIYYLHHYILGLDSSIIKNEGNFSSLLAIYDQCHIPVTCTEDELQAVEASEEVAKLLNIPPGTAVMLVNRRTYRDRHRLLEFVQFYVLTKNWKYRVRYQNK